LGVVSAGWGVNRGGAVDRFLFELVVGVLVDVGGLDAFVAEPQGDRCDVDVFGLQEHRVGVSEDVWADALGVERGALGCGRMGVFGEEQRDGLSSEWLSLPGGEQWVFGLALAFV
jgi:hypothetical protein